MSDPDHPHVKATLFMYSMESFLYKRINKIQRDMDCSAISTLGPFAVSLTRIIENASQKRKFPNRIENEFKVYRGIAVK